MKLNPIINWAHFFLMGVAITSLNLLYASELKRELSSTGWILCLFVGLGLLCVGLANIEAKKEEEV